MQRHPRLGLIVRVFQARGLGYCRMRGAREGLDAHALLGVRPCRLSGAEKTWLDVETRVRCGCRCLGDHVFRLRHSAAPLVRGCQS